jgi:WW domain-containing oxidoreductase
LRTDEDARGLVAACHCTPFTPGDSRVATSIPFNSRSTADQVLAGVDLSHKRVVVTECNSDIGFETMKALNANGARIVGLAHTLDDAKAACSAVGRGLTPLGCDPLDAGSVDAAVETIGISGPHDALVANSLELRSFADHIAQFVLINRLAELVRPGTGRIVVGSNDANVAEATAGNVTFDDLGDEQTKLATPLLAKELSRRLEARGVAVNAFHSRQGRRVPKGFIQSIVRYFSRSPAQLAATPALLAASPLISGITGEFWSDCQVSRGSPLFSDTSLAKRFWDVSAQIAASRLHRSVSYLSSP